MNPAPPASLGSVPESGSKLGLLVQLRLSRCPSARCSSSTCPPEPSGSPRFGDQARPVRGPLSPLGCLRSGGHITYPMGPSGLLHVWRAGCGRGCCAASYMGEGVPPHVAFGPGHYRLLVMWPPCRCLAGDAVAPQDVHRQAPPGGGSSFGCGLGRPLGYVTWLGPPQPSRKARLLGPQVINSSQF